MNARVLLRALQAVSFVLIAFSTSAPAEPACRNGGAYIANAFTRANPLYAMYYGDLPSYLRANQAHFGEGSDAVRCAAALSRAFMSDSIRLYDPADAQRKQLLDARMAQLGIGSKPGSQQPSMSSILFMMSISMGRMARNLPAAAQGDFGPWFTPMNDFESMQIMAERLLRQFLQDPSFRSIFAPYEQLFREAAEFDHYFVLQATQRLAKM